MSRGGHVPQDAAGGGVKSDQALVGPAVQLLVKDEDIEHTADVGTPTQAPSVGIQRSKPLVGRDEDQITLEGMGI